jgi:hypothetical protein
MDLGAIQSNIATQLTGAFSGTPFTTQVLPEGDAGYQRAVPDALAYIVYTSSETVGLISTDPIVQHRRLKFNVECYGRLLYGPAGLFQLRNLVESALIGYKPLNCDRLYLVKDEIGRGDDGIWSHVYSLECMTILAQDNFSEPIVIPSLISVSDSE